MLHVMIVYTHTHTHIYICYRFYIQQSKNPNNTKIYILKTQQILTTNIRNKPDPKKVGNNPLTINKNTTTIKQHQLSHSEITIFCYALYWPRTLIKAVSCNDHIKKYYNWEGSTCPIMGMLHCFGASQKKFLNEPSYKL